MLYFVPSLIVVGYKPFYKTMCVAKILSVSTVVVVDDDNRFPGKKNRYSAGNKPFKSRHFFGGGAFLALLA